MSETVRDTVRCPECGAKNEADDDFCGQCGAYLAWEAADAAASAEPVAVVSATAGAAAASASASEPEPEVEPEVAPEPVSEAAPDAAPTAPRVAPPSSRAPQPAVERAPEPAVTSTAPVLRESEPAATSTGRELPEPEPEPAAESTATDLPAPEPEAEHVHEPPAPEPVIDPALVPKPPQHAGPAAMKPVAVTPRPKPRPTVTAERPKPGDLVCPQCGTGNSPGRHFCRRCATPLGATANRRPVSSAQPAAGARPVVRTRRFRASWVVIPAIVAALAAVAWLARGPIGDFTQTVVDRVAASTARNPTGLTASTAASGRGPELAHDGFANLSWAPAAPGPATGEFLEASFAEPFRLVALQISPGASTDQAEFLAQGRPDDLRVSAMTSTGAVVERTVTLADEPGVQRIDLGIDDVVAVRLTIESANGATDTTHVAIAEVEFFGR